jgi:hypothetical protein
VLFSKPEKPGVRTDLKRHVLKMVIREVHVIHGETSRQNR